jgi:outer membrane PBP1 activator LpoA protein
MCGGSTLSVTSAGVTVAALAVTLGSADTTAATLQGMMTTVKADSIMTVQGPLTMIGA